MPVGLADPASRQPAHELIGRNLNLERVVDRGTLFAKCGIERGCLGARAGKPVEDDALFDVRLGQARQEHPHGDLVRHQLATLHVATSLEPDRGPLPDGQAKQVAGGDVRDSEMV